MSTKPTAVVDDETLELPQLFWPDDADPEPLKTPIELIYVYAIERSGAGAGEKSCAGVCTPDELPDVIALRERYGVGLWEVVGRSARGAICCKRIHPIRPLKGAPAAAAAEPAAPATHPTYAAPTPGYGAPPFDMQFFFKMLQDSHSQVVNAITQLSSARIGDAQDMFQNFMKMKQAVAAGGGGNIDAAAIYEKGMQKMMELYQLAAEGAEGEEGSGGDVIAQRLKTFTEALREFNTMQGRQNGHAQPPHATGNA